MLDASKNSSGWTTGINRMYITLAEDMLYKEPMNNCIFLDNHDRDRFYSVVNENWNNFQIGIGLLLTIRGIPHLYYGTEILMKNFKNPSDAMVRDDFPGGFAGDPDNKFLAAGRSSAENAAFDYVSKLANYRKSSDALKYGRLMQYVPANNMYVYARYNDKQTILCALNADTVVKTLKAGDFSERTRGFSTATDIMTGQTFSLEKEIELPSRSIRILELKK
jgi:glycosidase